MLKGEHRILNMDNLKSRNDAENLHQYVAQEVTRLSNQLMSMSPNDRIRVISSLWMTLMTSPRKTKYFAEAFVKLYRKTVLLVLNPTWLDVQPNLKQELSHNLSVRISDNEISKASKLCMELRNLANLPWDGLTIPWKPFLMGEVSLENQDIQRYFGREPEEIVMARVHFLVNAKHHEAALCLSRYYLRYKSRQHQKRIERENSLNCNADSTNEAFSASNAYAALKWFSSLLLRKKTIPEVINEVSSLNCHESIAVIKALLEKRSSKSIIMANQLIQAFLMWDLLKPKDYCCTKKLLELWCSTMKSYSPTQVSTSVREILAPLATSSAVFYLCADVFYNQFGHLLLSLYLELFIRGLTVDINYLEVARNQDSVEEIKELELHIASVFVKLATLFSDVSEVVERECVLSAFSLEPNKERLYLLQSLTHSILSSGELQAVWENELSQCDSECSKYVCGIKCSNACVKKKKVFHPLLSKGIKHIPYSLVKDLVIVLETVRCNAFQFNFFDWENAITELGDYLNTYATKLAECQLEMDYNSETEYASDESNSSVLHINEARGFRPLIMGSSPPTIQSQMIICRTSPEDNISTGLDVINDYSNLTVTNSTIPYVAETIEIQTENKMEEYQVENNAQRRQIDYVAHKIPREVVSLAESKAKSEHMAMKWNQSLKHFKVRNKTPIKSRLSVRQYEGPKTKQVPAIYNDGYNVCIPKFENSPSPKTIQNHLTPSNFFECKEDVSFADRMPIKPTPVSPSMKSSLLSHNVMQNRNIQEDDVVIVENVESDQLQQNNMENRSQSLPSGQLPLSQGLKADDTVSHNTMRYSLKKSSVHCESVSEDTNLKHIVTSLEGLGSPFRLIPSNNVSKHLSEKYKMSSNTSSGHKTFRAQKYVLHNPVKSSGTSPITYSQNYVSVTDRSQIRSRDQELDVKNTTIQPNNSVFQDLSIKSRPLILQKSKPFGSKDISMQSSTSTPKMLSVVARPKNYQNLLVPSKPNVVKLENYETHGRNSVIQYTNQQQQNPSADLESPVSANSVHSIVVNTRPKLAEEILQSVPISLDEEKDKAFRAKLVLDAKASNPDLLRVIEGYLVIRKSGNKELETTATSSVQSDNSALSNAQLSQQENNKCNMLKQSVASSLGKSHSLQNTSKKLIVTPSFLSNVTTLPVRSDNNCTKQINTTQSKNSLNSKTLMTVNSKILKRNIDETCFSSDTNQLHSISQQVNNAFSPVSSSREFWSPENKTVCNIKENNSSSPGKFSEVGNFSEVNYSNQLHHQKRFTDPAVNRKQSLASSSTLQKAVNQSHMTFSNSSVQTVPFCDSSSKRVRVSKRESLVDQTVNPESLPGLNANKVRSASVQEYSNITNELTGAYTNASTVENSTSMNSQSSVSYNVGCISSLSPASTSLSPAVKDFTSQCSQSFVHSSPKAPMCCSPHEIQKCQNCHQKDENSQSFFISNSNEASMTAHQRVNSQFHEGSPLTGQRLQEGLLGKEKIINLPPKVKKKFQCEICQKLLSSKHTLKQHEFNIHSGKNPRRRKKSCMLPSQNPLVFDPISISSSELQTEKTYASYTTVKLEPPETQSNTSYASNVLKNQTESFNNQVQLDTLFDQYSTDTHFSDKIEKYFSNFTDPQSMSRLGTEPACETFISKKADMSIPNVQEQSQTGLRLSGDSSIVPCDDLVPSVLPDSLVQQELKNSEGSLQASAYYPDTELQSSWQVAGTAIRYLNDPSYVDDEQLLSEFPSSYSQMSENNNSSISNSQMCLANSPYSPTNTSKSQTVPSNNFSHPKSALAEQNFQSGKFYNASENSSLIENQNWQPIEPNIFKIECAICKDVFSSEESLRVHANDVHGNVLQTEPSVSLYTSPSQSNMNTLSSISNLMSLEQQEYDSALSELDKQNNLTGCEQQTSQTKANIPASNDNSLCSAMEAELAGISTPNSYSILSNASCEVTNLSLGTVSNENSLSFIQMESSPLSFTEKQLFPCDECLFTFNSPQTKHDHMRRVHNIYIHKKQVPVANMQLNESAQINSKSSSNNTVKVSCSSQDFELAVSHLPSSTVLYPVGGNIPSNQNSNTPADDGSKSNSSSPYGFIKKLVQTKGFPLSKKYSGIKESSPILASFLASTPCCQPSDSLKLLSIKQEIDETEYSVCQESPINKLQRNEDILYQEKTKQGKGVPSSCDLCKKTFCSVASKRRHLKNVHKEEPSETPEARSEKELRERILMNNVKAILEKTAAELQRSEATAKNFKRSKTKSNIHSPVISNPQIPISTNTKIDVRITSQESCFTSSVSQQTVSPLPSDVSLMSPFSPPEIGESQHSMPKLSPIHRPNVGHSPTNIPSTFQQTPDVTHQQITEQKCEQITEQKCDQFIQKSPFERNTNLSHVTTYATKCAATLNGTVENSVDQVNSRSKLSEVSTVGNTASIKIALEEPIISLLPKDTSISIKPCEPTFQSPSRSVVTAESSALIDTITMKPFINPIKYNNNESTIKSPGFSVIRLENVSADHPGSSNFKMTADKSRRYSLEQVKKSVEKNIKGNIIDSKAQKSPGYTIIPGTKSYVKPGYSRIVQIKKPLVKNFKGNPCELENRESPGFSRVTGPRNYLIPKDNEISQIKRKPGFSVVKIKDRCTSASKVKIEKMNTNTPIKNQSVSVAIQHSPTSQQVPPQNEVIKTPVSNTSSSSVAHNQLVVKQSKNSQNSVSQNMKALKNNQIQNQRASRLPVSVNEQRISSTVRTSLNRLTCQGLLQKSPAVKLVRLNNPGSAVLSLPKAKTEVVPITVLGSDGNKTNVLPQDLLKVTELISQIQRQSVSFKKQSASGTFKKKPDVNTVIDSKDQGENISAESSSETENKMVNDIKTKLNPDGQKTSQEDSCPKIILRKVKSSHKNLKLRYYVPKKRKRKSSKRQTNNAETVKKHVKLNSRRTRKCSVVLNKIKLSRESAKKTPCASNRGRRTGKKNLKKKVCLPNIAPIKKRIKREPSWQKDTVPSSESQSLDTCKVLLEKLPDQSENRGLKRTASVEELFEIPKQQKTLRSRSKPVIRRRERRRSMRLKQTVGWVKTESILNDENISHSPICITLD